MKAHVSNGCKPCPFCGAPVTVRLMRKGPDFIACTNKQECGAIFSFNNTPCDCFGASPVDYFNRRASTDEIALVEDAPAVVPDFQRWRKTAEEPPTEKDSAHGNVLVKYMDATFAQSAAWDTVASAPDLFTLWMPMPKLPGERSKKLYWREKAGTTICPVCGYECDDDYYLDKFCTGCGTRLWFNEEGAEHGQPDMQRLPCPVSCLP